ncbi:GNAT family N-acetyltransferase [Haloarchaeobius baliensis]|uniref:GNAT family N-acetyltransferase n=1 Tax=Haloarchaeobius baliensis TaxID=1670458 RepID=UPI003F8824AC
MTDQFDVRTFDPDDTGRIEAIRRDALRSAGVAYGDALDTVDPDALRADYLDSRGAFLVGTLDGTVVATGAFRPAGEFQEAVFDGVDAATAELKWMHVDPAHHRRGFASEMLGELESLALDRGFDSVVLHTSADQTAARRFYERHGYELVTRTQEKIGDAAFEALHYRRALSGGL